jgi:hypothetical protein
MYLGTFDNYGGDGSIMSKFGFEYRDTLELWVSRTRFAQELGNVIPSITFPREGDVVYVPFLKGFFEITFVDKNAIFMQFGHYFSYKLKVERMRFSQETIVTGDSPLSGIANDVTLDSIAARAPDLTTDNIENDHEQSNVAIEDEADYKHIPVLDINKDMFADQPAIVPDPVLPGAGTTTTTTTPDPNAIIRRGTGIIDFTETDVFSNSHY